MECYQTISFAEVSSDAFQQYHDCTYFQCWGGGPEGGFLTRVDANGNFQLYKANRQWSPWVITPEQGILIVKWEVDEFGHGTKYVKIKLEL